ncbi:hypothetical protein Lal_00030120 [Lupinus albus]|nr:hypothetical protein Lal_00030120 [Lupinus albus]
MASSSKRPCSSKSKQGESTSKSNLLNLTRLLANDAQRKVFEENFHGRAIFTPKYGNIENFEFEDFLFPYLLRQQKLFDFCCEANDIYPELVRVFYCNMNFRKNLTTSHVKGKDIVLDFKTFSSICCIIPMIGDITRFSMVCDWDDYNRKKFYLSICKISKEEIERKKQQSLGETVKNRDILSAGYLTLEDRLIHYFLTYTKMIMQQMWHVRGSQSLLPYAIFIAKILEHFGVPLEDETKVALNLRESKVDIEVVHKMGFVIDPVTRRTYKHHTDRQPAPTNEPKPTAEPNQSESHAQSSSSAAMPTNQMIMDELVSLRGYITTRMDVFNTQSQQIHYELHRLSPRLSNMDAHNSKRKGEKIPAYIEGEHTQDNSRYIIKYAALKKLHFQEDIGGDCEEDLAPDLGTVLMKTPISQKEERKKTYEDDQR